MSAIPMTWADATTLTVRELKALLRERDVDFSKCIEKSDLIALLVNCEGNPVNAVASAKAGAVRLHIGPITSAIPMDIVNYIGSFVNAPIYCQGNKVRSFLTPTLMNLDNTLESCLVKKTITSLKYFNSLKKKKNAILQQKTTSYYEEWMVPDDLNNSTRDSERCIAQNGRGRCRGTNVWGSTFCSKHTECKKLWFAKPTVFGGSDSEHVRNYLNRDNLTTQDIAYFTHRKKPKFMMTENDLARAKFFVDKITPTQY